ncbi:MAG: hypothetical protein ACWGQW_01980 [bacterium]
MKVYRFEYLSYRGEKRTAETLVPDEYGAKEVKAYLEKEVGLLEVGEITLQGHIGDAP